MGQKAVIYVRISTFDQSCERQIGEFTSSAERGDFAIVGVFKETASGTKSNRAARNQIMDLAQARRIDAVLVTELSRWGRSTQDFLQILEQLTGWNVSINAISGMIFELSHHTDV